MELYGELRNWRIWRGCGARSKLGVENRLGAEGGGVWIGVVRRPEAEGIVGGVCRDGGFGVVCRAEGTEGGSSGSSTGGATELKRDGG